MAAVCGLDIETDTSVDGLDPAVGAVVAVALSTPDGDEVLTGPEAHLLARLDAWLAAAPPLVLATWNGARFDLPYLADRARRTGVTLGLHLEPDERPTTHDPLPGHPGGYRARWYAHGHLDVYRLYRADLAPALDLSCSLKTVARLAGLAPVEVDLAALHLLDPAQVAEYVASDARCTRVLLERRGAAALAAVDRVTGVHPSILS